MAWLDANPDQRLRAGVIRGDGKVFLGYGYGYKNGEHWTTPEMAERQAERARIQQRKNRKDPAFKQRFNEYIKHRYPNREMRLNKTRERSKVWRAANVPRLNQKSRLRYALKRSLLHPEHDKTIERQLFEEAARLQRETGQGYHVDHIIPLKLGGWHHHLNLQVLPDQVNYDKWAKPFWEMPGYKSWRDVPEHLWPADLAPLYRERLLKSA